MYAATTKDEGQRCRWAFFSSLLECCRLTFSLKRESFKGRVTAVQHSLNLR